MSTRLLLLLVLIIRTITMALGLPVSGTDEGEVGEIDNKAEVITAGGPGAPVNTIPQGTSKCSTGCGIGIGIGCAVAVLLFSFIFVMARRHKRQLHHLWMYKRWESKHKELPDKPVPVPPTPSKI
ncbi:hypothetical protein BX661DRAFT_184451 [Kickxella alabastrina]|uniref:uncharacterized protein n=1 Tax=Kickxella alabastrina TaxID=61397 RepID=UPI00221F4E2B|nr:uncharacterized protein BX661DRAFT_184451 [Kickxella alabastrina]KAI7825953.1 hypothetical protein BX661DRAFT_184451 [Kickxella alabastrina]